MIRAGRASHRHHRSCRVLRIEQRLRGSLPASQPPVIGSAARVSPNFSWPVLTPASELLRVPMLRVLVTSPRPSSCLCCCCCYSCFRFCILLPHCNAACVLQHAAAAAFTCLALLSSRSHVLCCLSKCALLLPHTHQLSRILGVVVKALDFKFITGHQIAGYLVVLSSSVKWIPVTCCRA